MHQLHRAPVASLWWSSWAGFRSRLDSELVPLVPSPRDGLSMSFDVFGEKVRMRATEFSFVLTLTLSRTES